MDFGQCAGWTKDCAAPCGVGGYNKSAFGALFVTRDTSQIFEIVESAEICGRVTVRGHFFEKMRVRESASAPPKIMFRFSLLHSCDESL
jgi:hypothetical protein